MSELVGMDDAYFQGYEACLKNVKAIIQEIKQYADEKVIEGSYPYHSGFIRALELLEENLK